MTQWRIEVTCGDTTLLSFLTKYLQKSSVTIIEDMGKYYLIAPEFESLTECTKLCQRADQLLHLLNNLIKLQLGNSPKVTRNNAVTYIDEYGQPRTIVQHTVSAVVRFRLQAGDAFFEDTMARQPNLIDKWLRESIDYPVEEALSYYGDETNWHTLYNVYEIIKNDVKQMVVNSVLPTNPFDNWTQDETGRSREEDFTEYANNFNLSGEKARHSAAKSFRVEQVAPSLWHVFRKEKNSRLKDIDVISMPLDEAKKFIDRLLTEWMQVKN